MRLCRAQGCIPPRLTLVQPHSRHCTPPLYVFFFIEPPSLFPLSSATMLFRSISLCSTSTYTLKAVLTTALIIGGGVTVFHHRFSTSRARLTRKSNNFPYYRSFPSLVNHRSSINFLISSRNHTLLSRFSPPRSFFFSYFFFLFFTYIVIREYDRYHDLSANLYLSRMLFDRILFVIILMRFISTNDSITSGKFIGSNSFAFPRRKGKWKNW